MSVWISVTPGLQQGLELVAQLDNGKLRPLVNRICQGLCTTSNDRIFTAEEEEKLMTSLVLDKNALTLLLDTITLIYSQAAFSVVKPAVMESVMKDSFPITDDKISIFVNAWISHAKRIVECLRQKSVFPTQLDDVNWSLNIQAASPDVVLEPKPTVLLQLNLHGPETKPVTVEMGKNALMDLYNQLEKVQSQLDALK